MDWRSVRGEVDPRSLPPEVVCEVKALARELPARWGVAAVATAHPRYQGQDHQPGYRERWSWTTIWRWLCEDAISPWAHRSWIFARDSSFALKAGRVLDPYARGRTRS